MKPRTVRVTALGAVVIGLGAVLYFMVPPLRSRSQNRYCRDNLKQLGLAMMQYVRDYDEKFPLTHQWKNGLKPYARWMRSSSAPTVFECPTTQRGYAFNGGIAGAPLSIVPHPETIALFYEPSRPILADGGASWPIGGIHDGGSNVCFQDGHVKWLTVKSRFWTPELNDVAGYTKRMEAENRRLTAQYRASQLQQRQQNAALNKQRPSKR